MNATGRRRVSKAVVARRNKRQEVYALVFSGLMLALVVALLLRGRGIAATHTEQVLDCHYAGSGAHTHDASCYDAAGNLVCPLVEREYHVHDDSCYTERRELACGREEHTHTEACYDEEGNLSCGLEEHAHTDACYQVTRELTCGKEEITETHTHGPGCFRTVTVEEAEPAGGEALVTQAEQPTEAVNLVTADDSIDFPAQTFTGELKERDEEGNERVILTINIKAPEGALPAGTQLVMKAIEGDELRTTAAYVEEAVKKADRHATGISWMQAVGFMFTDAFGNEVRPEKKIELKITHDRIREIENPVLARTLDAKAKAQFNRDEDAEVLNDVAITNLLDEDTSTGNENTFTFKSRVPGTYVIVEVAHEDEAAVVDDAPVEAVDPGEGSEPVEPAEDVAPTSDDTATDETPAEAEDQAEASANMVEVEINTMPARSFDAEVEGMTVSVEAPDGALAEDVQMVAASVEPDEVRSQVENVVGSDFDQVADLAAVNISFVDAEGNKVEPAKPVEVSLTSDIVADAEKPMLVQVGEDPSVVDGAEVVTSQDGTATTDEGEETAEAVDAEADGAETKESHGNSVDGAEDTMRFEGEGSGTYAVVAIETLTSKVITATGSTYVVSVTYGPDAGIPAGAELRVSEIAESDQEYAEAQKAVDKGMDQDKEKIPSHPTLFDISIWCDGQEIEPAEGSEVQVEVKLVGSALKGMYTDEDSPLLVNNMPITDSASEMEKQVQVLHLAGDDQIDVVETEDVISNKGITSSFTTDSFSNWLLYLDEDLTSINVTTGDSLTLRPYTEWVWKQSDETEQYAGGQWTFPTDEWRATTSGGTTTYTHITNGSVFRSFQKTDSQLNETYTVVTSVSLSAGTFDLKTNKGKTIHVNVTQGDASGKPGTVQGVSGLTVNLFDYDVPYQKNQNGQNIPNTFDFTKSGDLDVESNVAREPINGSYNNPNINYNHDLKFLGYGGGNVDNNDTWFWINNYTNANPQQGIVKNALGADGYPVLVPGKNGQERGNPSLAYLFNTNSRNNNVYAFPGADGLFQRDNQGYYYYNSNANYAEYDQSTNKFVLYEHTYSQNTGGSNGANAKPIGFFPFHEYDTVDTQPEMNFNKNLNHHFGMSMEVEFEIPKDRKAADDHGYKHDIIYEFSGDDDLWVFVDDQLVLDIGGIHQPVTGTINFTTGEIKVHGVDDKTMSFNVGPHKLKMFYIERGGCDSNLSVRFNLPLIIGRGNVRIAKKSMTTDSANEDSYLPGAVFGIWDNPNCEGDPYTIATSDSNGIVFKHLPIREEGQNYYLKEISPPEGYLLDGTIYTLTAAGKDSNGEYTFTISSNGSVISETDGTYGYPIIRNRLQQPISVGVHKTWQSADGTTIDPQNLPANLTATFVVKRFRTHSTEPFLTVNLKSDAANAQPFETISAYAGDVLTICYEHAPDSNGTTAYGTANGQQVLTLPTNADGSEISVNYTVNAQHAVNDVIDIVIPLSFLNDCDGTNYQGKNPEFDNIQLADHHMVREQDTVYNNKEEDHKIVLSAAANWTGALSNLTLQEKIDGVVYHYEYYVVEKDLPEGFEVIFLDADRNPVADPASQAATDTNTQEVINRELLDVPIQKQWADFSGEAYTWTATFQLDQKEVKVNADDPDAPDALTTDFVPVDGKIMTIEKGQSPAPKFKGLPMYRVHDNGTVYRILYSVVEIGYTVKRGETIVVQWGKNANGEDLEIIGDTRFEPQFDQDAGEHGSTIGDYIIKIVNVMHSRILSKEIDLTVQKTWPEGSTYATDDNAYATFALKRYVHEEHRDYRNVDASAEWVTITLKTWGNDDSKDQKVTVPLGSTVHVMGNILPKTNANQIAFSQSGGGNPITLVQNNPAETVLPFDISVTADQTKTITLTQGDNYVVGGRDGFRLSDYQTKGNDTPDRTFGIELADGSHGETFTLSKAHGWSTTFEYLPLIEEQDIDPKTGAQTIYVFSYYLEELECSPADFSPVFTVSNGIPFAISPNNRIESTMSITAENVQKTTDVTLKKVSKDQVNVEDAPTLAGAAFDIKKYADARYQGLDTTWGIRGVKSMTDVNNNGLFSFEGLPAGYYKIVETAWPDGHVKLSEDPIFEVRWNPTAKKLEVILLNPNDGTDATNNTTDMVRVNDFTIIVGNEPGVELPAAGGSGTWPIYLLGCAMLAAGALTLRRRLVR